MCNLSSLDITTPSSSSASSEEHRKQLNYDRQKYFKDKNKKTASNLSVNISEDLQLLLSAEVPTVETASNLSVNVSEDLQPLLSTEVPIVETPAIDSDSDSAPSEEQ
ncbi:31345_t:CDS:1 [Racocetra persica]|uniref:31345_t:CDS:1 n=1 Tax=Racocetra persica TaxID=160502 RepID=A0ACA9KAF8_9GLOM|nr:31345_t:CDS:1 [Racocetra persica]